MEEFGGAWVPWQLSRPPLQMALKAMEEEAALTQRLERRLDGIPDGWLTAAANAAAVRAGNQPQLPTPTHTSTHRHSLQ